MASPVRLLLVMLGLVACTPPAARPIVPAPPTSGADVVARMHARWSGRWFTTLTVTQQNSRVTRDGREEPTTWLLWLQTPGKLRLEFLPTVAQAMNPSAPAADNGALYVDGRVTTITGGTPARPQDQLNAILLLTADIHAQPVAETVKQLTTLGVDLTTVRRDTFETRPVWVVGAAAGDLTRPQLWVDAARWTVLRAVDRPVGTTGGRVSAATEYRLRDVREVGGVPIAHEILVLRDGQRVVRQRWTQVRIDVPLDPALFDATQWRRAQR
jgi:hypothetical protein